MRLYRTALYNALFNISQESRRAIDVGQAGLQRPWSYEFEPRERESLEKGVRCVMGLRERVLL